MRDTLTASYNQALMLRPWLNASARARVALKLSGKRLCNAGLWTTQAYHDETAPAHTMPHAMHRACLLLVCLQYQGTPRSVSAYVALCGRT